MLSTSPDHAPAASPPGAPSSQSSSAGSCYTSSSSQASLRARPAPSDPSSSATSPASAFDRSSDLHHTPALAKRPSDGATGHINYSFSALSAHPEPPYNSRQFGSASSNISPRTDSTRTDSTSRGTMNPPSALTYDTIDSRGHTRAGPSSRSHSDAAAPAPHDLPYSEGGSPDNTRGPAPKTRRTSPGGSRASGNLAPSQRERMEGSHSGYSGASTASADPERGSQFGAGPDASAHMSSASSTLHGTSSEASQASAPRHAVNISEHWSVVGQGPRDSPTAATKFSPAPSPRTRSDGRKHSAEQPISGFSDAQASASASSRASATSTSDRGENRSQPSSMPKMDLATFPPQELLKILATLLQEIATANDEFQPDGSKDETSRSRRSARNRDRSTSNVPAEAGDSAESSAMRDCAAPPGSHLSFSDSRRPSVTTAALGALATPSSTLCFHARNVPSISIESYLLRILKYCPTTNEVFLSLLVYFDRMSRMGSGAKPGANGGGEAAGEAAGLPRALERVTGQYDAGTGSSAARDAEDAGSSKAEHAAAHPGIRGFAIDSYNVHRLVIAGVTVASKFFSDVFYTNSRYAKVGGLPPHELNQLELQFLLLNDFRLTIPLEEMQRYADQLLMYGSGRAELAKLTKQIGPGGASETRRPIVQSGEAAESRLPTGTAAEPGRDSAATQAASEPRSANEAGVDTQGDVHMSDAKAD